MLLKLNPTKAGTIHIQYLDLVISVPIDVQTYLWHKSNTIKCISPRMQTIIWDYHSTFPLLLDIITYYLVVQLVCSSCDENALKLLKFWLKILVLIFKDSLSIVICWVWIGFHFQSNYIGKCDLIHAPANFHVIITCYWALSHKLLL